MLALVFFSISNKSLLGQDKKDVTAENVIDRFVEKIGGEKWLSLTSRKEYGFVEYEEDRNAIIPSKSYDRIMIHLNQGRSLEMHGDITNLKSVLVYKPDCNWYYSSASQVVKFFGPEPIKFKRKFPRTELMEALNLEPVKTVYIEDTLYRVDFKDIRQLDGIQSLFFGMNSGLLYKREFISKNEVKWEFQFSNYKTSNGYVEPRLIKLTSNGEGYFSIVVESITYNIEIEQELFNPPIPCKNFDDFERLEFPYILNLK
jgi:hypothetical protein